MEQEIDFRLHVIHLIKHKSYFIEQSLANSQAPDLCDIVTLSLRHPSAVDYCQSKV